MRSTDAQKDWGIKYTGTPHLRGKDRGALESGIDEHMKKILECINSFSPEKIGESVLIDPKFVLQVECYNGKYLMTIFNRSCDSVAVLTLNSHPCIDLNEAKQICQEKGFTDIGGWMLEAGSVRELLDRMSTLMMDDPEDPYLADLKDRYEEALLKGIIAEDDSIQDADGKITYILRRIR